jgi:hypothetical protein
LYDAEVEMSLAGLLVVEWLGAKESEMPRFSLDLKLFG